MAIFFQLQGWWRCTSELELKWLKKFIWNHSIISVSKYFKIQKISTVYVFTLAAEEGLRYGRTWTPDSFRDCFTIFSQLAPACEKQICSFFAFHNFPQWWRNWWEQLRRWGQHCITTIITTTSTKTAATKNKRQSALFPFFDCYYQTLKGSSKDYIKW